MSRRRGLTGVLVVIGLGMLAPVASAETWSPPETVTGNGFMGRAAVGADGTAAVVWLHTTALHGGEPAVAARVREADGSWDEPQLLSASAPPGGVVQVAVTAAGEVIVAFVADGAVQAAIRPRRGDFGTPQRIATGDMAELDLVTTAAGEATLAWSDSYTVYTARRAVDADSFGPAEETASGSGPQLAVSAAGTTALAWAAGQDRGTVVRVAKRSQGGEFGEWVSVSGWPYFTDLASFMLAGHADGSLGLLLQIYSGRVAATAPPGGAFRATQPIDAGNRGFDAASAGVHPGFAVGPGGRAIVVTPVTQFSKSPNSSGYSGVPAGVQLQMIDDSGTAGPILDVPGVTHASHADAAFDLHGTAVATFDAGGWTAAVGVHQDQAPCPAERIGSGMSLQTAPMLDRGPVGVAAWGEPATTNVHMATYRARPGICPPPLPQPEPEVAPAAPEPAAARGRAPKVARIARVAANGRSVRLRLTCTGAAVAPCDGQLQLFSTRAARTSASPKRLGRARFDVRAGRSRSVRLRLSRKVSRGARADVRLLVPGRATRARRVTLR